MPTRLLLWEQRTSVLLASTPRRPCTLALACSATLCLTGKCSQSPSAASSTAPPSSLATTGRSRASCTPLRGSVFCKWVCESFVSVRVTPPPSPLIPYQHCVPTNDDVINPHTHFKTFSGHGPSTLSVSLFSLKVGTAVHHTAYRKHQHILVMLSHTAHHSQNQLSEH